MKTYVLAVLTAATLTFAAAAYAMPADTATPSSPGGWSLTGSGAIRNTVTNAILASANGSAHSEEAGLNPKGQFHLFFTGVEDTKMDVLCLSVIGNKAGVFGKLAQPAQLGSTTYPYGGISVTDNGSASASPRDQVTWWVGPAAPNQALCTFLAASGGFSPVTDGNFVVNDQQPGGMLGLLAPPSVPAGLVRLG